MGSGTSFFVTVVVANIELVYIQNTTFLTSHKRTPLVGGHFFWSRGCPFTGGLTVLFQPTDRPTDRPTDQPTNYTKTKSDWFAVWDWKALCAYPRQDVATCTVARYRTRFCANLPASFVMYPSLL